MTNQRFTLRYNNNNYEFDNIIQDNGRILRSKEVLDILNELNDENQMLQMYKDSVSEVLLSWSQKDLTAKQLQVVIAIMQELNVKVNMND